MTTVTVTNNPVSINRCVSAALILLLAAAAKAATVVNTTTGEKMEPNDAQCRSVQSDAWLDVERVQQARRVFTAAVESFDETTGLSIIVVRMKSMMRHDRQLERRQVTIEYLIRGMHREQLAAEQTELLTPNNDIGRSFSCGALTMLCVAQ